MPAAASRTDLGAATRLIWDHMSRPPDADPVARVHAASDAGFDGIGLFVRAWQHLRRDPAHVDRLDAALEETGLRIAGMEVAKGWPAPGAGGDEAAAFESAAWELAARYGCSYLQAIGSDVGAPADAAPGFGALCDRAADHGVRVGLEFVPEMTDVGTAAVAAEIVERADRANGGLCVDSWHVTRSTGRVDDVLGLPGEKIYWVQLNDGPIAPDHPDYYTDTISNRRAPGHGEFDLVGLIGNLDAVGASCPFGIEVCSTELWAADVDVAARTSHDGLLDVLAAARGHSGSTGGNER